MDNKFFALQYLSEARILDRVGNTTLSAKMIVEAREMLRKAVHLGRMTEAEAIKTFLEAAPEGTTWESE